MTILIALFTVYSIYSIQSNLFYLKYCYKAWAANVLPKLNNSQDRSENKILPSFTLA